MCRFQAKNGDFEKYLHFFCGKMKNIPACERVKATGGYNFAN